MIISDWTTATPERLDAPRAAVWATVRGRREGATSGWDEVPLLAGSRLSLDDERRPWITGTLRVHPRGTGTAWDGMLADGLLGIYQGHELMVEAGYHWPDGTTEQHDLAHLLITGCTRSEGPDGVTYDLEVSSGDILPTWETITSATPLGSAELGSPSTPGTWRVGEYMNAISNYVHTPYSLPANATLAVPETYVAPAYAQVSDILDAVGDFYRGRRWRQTSATGDLRSFTYAPIATVDTAAAHDARLGRVEHTIYSSMDRWANVVHLEYDDGTTTSTPPTGGDLLRTLTVRRQGDAGGSTEAYADVLADRASRRDAEITFTARTHWGLRPGHTVHDPDWPFVFPPDRYRIASAVEFDLTAGTMTVKTRAVSAIAAE